MRGGLISVVVPLPPAHTPRPTLVDSIDRQTYRRHELVVVNGPNVQENRNLGAKRARGEFLFFCDADVTLEPTCLEELHAALVSSVASYAYCDFNRTGHFTGTFRSRPFDVERLKAANYVSTMSLVRADDFPGFNPVLPRLQDWDLWLTLLERGKVGTYVSRTLFTAHFDANGISARGDEDARAAVARVRALHPNLYA